MIECQFTCHKCGVTDAKFLVRDRTPSENVLTWLEAASRVMSAVHRVLSPWCAAGTADLKVPLSPSSDLIGAPTKH